MSSQSSSKGDVEVETGPSSLDGVEELDIHGSTHGYILDEKQLCEHAGLNPHTNLKRASNGVVLIPQPSEDPQDPLNWSRWKKAGILLVIVSNAFSSDYTAATGASAVVPQAHEWHMSPTTVIHATAGTTFMTGFGGLATVWLSAYVGRLPTLFWFSIFSCATAAWTAAAGNFESYMAAKILNGFFVVAAAAGGLMWIKDVWFFHEHPRKVNIWSTSLILSPYLGPQLMAAVLSRSSWRTGVWLNFGIIAFGLMCTVLLGEETFYPRHLRADQIAVRRSRILRLLGIEQVMMNWTTNSFLGAGSRLQRTLFKLPVILTCVYYFLDFPWTMGINITISYYLVSEYTFSYRDVATIYAAPILGALCSLALGHFAFDYLGTLYVKHNRDGVLEPENRLLILWPILPIKLASQVLVGLALHNHWSPYSLAVVWAIHTATTVITTASLGAYLIDAYPDAAGETGAWLNMSRTMGGFILGYVQIPWANKIGTTNEYGIQAGIAGVAFSIVVLLQVYGKRWRLRQGPLRFKTS